VGGAPNPRKAIYAEVLSRVREVMIGHMAKPEEVLIEEDECGEIVRGERLQL
jgi:exportin-1